MVVVSFPEQVREVLDSAGTHLCVGLDPDPSRLPSSRSGADPPEVMEEFLRGIVTATAPYCAAFKFQFAGFLALGPRGGALMAHLRREIPSRHLTILDLKVGDVPHTMRLYGKGIFGEYGFDAVTANPYLGWEALEALAQDSKGGILVLLHTSNVGSADVQDIPTGVGGSVWKVLLEGLRQRAREGRYGAVVGATFPEPLAEARRTLGPEVPILVPGVGVQGADPHETLALAPGNTLVNSSRSILYASSGDDWQEAAAQEARKLSEALATRP
jgi:orotidine-5'-phosphate decarboxylase